MTWTWLDCTTSVKHGSRCVYLFAEFEPGYQHRIRLLMIFKGQTVMQPRPYQIDALERLRSSALSGKKRLLLVSPTASGKTFMACMVIASASIKKKSTLFLAHTREIVNQTSELLWDMGIPHGIIMRGEEYCPANVQLASKDTILSRAFRKKKINLPHADLLFIDEAHRSICGGYKKIIQSYPDAFVVGLTATPVRHDGRGLGEIYEDMIVVTTTAELIEQKFLVPFQVYAPYVPNMNGVRTVNGDFDQKEIGNRMDKPTLVGDIVGHWERLARGRSTIVFAVNISHSLHIRDRFVEAGFKFEHLDGNTPIDQRETILGRLKAGEIDGIVNVGVCTEGFNAQRVSCIVLARPTKSLGLHIQMIGRSLRIHPESNKVDTIILDHAGNTIRLGMPDEDIEWTLDSKQKAKVRSLQKNGPKEKLPKTCPKCFMVFRSSRVCPGCGYELSTVAKPKHYRNGLLRKVNGETRQTQSSKIDYQKMWNACLMIAAYKGYSCAQAAMIFKDKTGGLLPWQIKPSLDRLPAYNSWKYPAASMFSKIVSEFLVNKQDKRQENNHAL